MPVFASYKYWVDWENTGTFGGTYDDISAYVLDAEWDRGQTPGTDLVPKHTAGNCQFTLDNRDGFFSDYNIGSFIFGKAIPGRRIKITMQIGSGAVKTMWAGRLDELEPELTSEPQLMKMKLKGIGILEWLEQRKKVIISIQENVSTQGLLNAIAQAAGLVVGVDTRFDVGQTVFQRFWIENEVSALQAFRLVTDTDGGNLCEGGDGTLVYEDRAHRFSAPHIHSSGQPVYTNDVSGSIRYDKIDQILSGSKSVFNRIEASVRTFDLTEEKLLISHIDIYNQSGQIGQVFEIADGATEGIALPFPGTGASSNELSVNAWTMLDMQADTEPDGSGTDVSGDVDCYPSYCSNGAYVTFYNHSGDTAYIVVLRAWGVAVVEGPTASVFAEDTGSIDKYGERIYPYPGQWLESVGQAQGWCNYLLSLHKEPTRAEQVRIDANVNAAHLLEAYSRELSDRVTIVGDSKTSLFVNEDFFIEHLHHRVEANAIHTVDYIGYVVAGTQWSAVDDPYTPATVCNVVPEASKVPSQLWVAGTLSAMRIIFSCKASKWNEGIDQAEFRAKLIPSGTSVPSVDMTSVAEGGTFVDNGTTQIIKTGLTATWQGVHHQLFYGANVGRWYYAWRLHNETGWSTWSDGNDLPSLVTDYVDTEDTAFSDSGPPSDWTVTIQQGPIAGTAVAVASRPVTNGKKIWFTNFQIRDSSAGSWRDIDANAGAAVVLYDGSLIDCIYDPSDGTIVPTTGDFSAAAGQDGLMIFDVRKGQFNKDYTRWGGLSGSQITAAAITGVVGIDPVYSPEVDGTYIQFRLMIVKAPWDWNNGSPANTDGFLGQAGFNGGALGDLWDNSTRGDVDSISFKSAPFVIPGGVNFADLQAKVWFGNEYSFSDGGVVSACPEGVPSAYQVPLVDAPVVATPARLSTIQTVFLVNVTDSRILGPPSNGVAGQNFLWCLVNDTGSDVIITLDSSFRWGIDVYVEDAIALIP